MNWLGAFPVAYDPNKKRFSTSRLGLSVSLAHVAVISLETYRCVTELVFGIVKRKSAAAAIVSGINAFGSMFLLSRRIAFVGYTVRCYNGLSDDWPADVAVRRSSELVFYTSAAALSIEILGDNFMR